MRARKIAAATAVALTTATAWVAAPAAAATGSELTAAVLSPTTRALVTSSNLTSPDATATAVRTDALAGFPSRAGGSYAVLATGAASHLGNPQYTPGEFGSSSAGTRGAAAYDVTTLEVRLDVPATANCMLGVTFRFLTDEAPGDLYNDGFIAEVGQSTWQISGSTINAPNNFAFDSAGKVVSVNSGLFSNQAAAVAEAAGTSYAFASPRLTAQVPLTPGTQQSLFFSIFDAGDASVDSAVMIDNLRIGTVADPATECVRGATVRGPEDLVSAVAPTTVDLSGTADDTYTIPTTDGVVYSVDGAVKPAGTYPGTGTVVVTATAASGFALSGPTQFTLQFSSAAHVTATEPTWTDTWGTQDDTYTIPSVTGVQYSVGGSPVAAGTHPATGTVTVTASAASSAYVLNGATEFSHTFTDVRQATASEPTWTDTWGTQDDTYTIPSVTGVQYSVGGNPVAAGTHPATGTVTVDAAAVPGYVLTGPAQFTHTFTDIRQVTAVEPTWIDPLGTADDRVVIPSVPGVRYYSNGYVVSAGTYMIASGTAELSITVQATSGYVLVGPTAFTYTYTNGQQVSATAPSVHDPYGTDEDAYTIPSTAGVEYLIDGEVVPAGTYSVSTPTTFTVTARPLRGNELTGPSTWELATTDIRLATAVEPTWNDGYGTDDDTYVIPDVTGVQYSVGGSPVAAGPHPAAGEVTVTATATTGYVLSGPSQFTYTFTDIRLVTATAPTWADAYGTQDDTVTIPSVEGVQYFLDGDPVDAGVAHGVGTVVVTAAATAGYELTGASQFTFTFTDIRLVTATAPTFADPWGTEDDTVTIPTLEGVQYAIDGSTAAAGEHPAAGTVVVTAAPQAGYELTGPTQWTFAFTDIRLVTASAPTQSDPYGTEDDTYTIPSVTGVQYSVGGEVVAPGTYPGSGTVVVTATATAGHALSGVSQFTLVFTNIVLATPVAPTWTDVDGTASDTYTIPAVDGVVYTVGGGVVAPGTHPASGTVTVVATAAPGYELTGTTVFSHAFTDLTHVSALAPTTRDEPGTARDRVTIPAVAGVTYLLDGTTIPAGSHALTGDLVVTAQAADARHVLVGTSRFELHLSDADVPGQPVVSATAGSGSVDLTWPVPAGAPTGYDVQKSFDGKTWTAAASTTRPSATVTGLDDGRTVAFRVRAVNGLGAGAWSTSVTATPVSLPGAPTITAVESGNRTLQVTFDAPASDGGAAVERYEYTRDGGATWTAADGSPVELTGLVNGTEYVVQVRAVTVVGTGPASARATGTPRPAPVQVPGEDGSPARPRVDPGVVRGWVGDETTPLVVGVRDGRRTVSGPGFDVVLGGSDAAGVQLPVDPEGRIIVGAGGFVDVAGSGFAPGEQVDVWLFSTPVLLGTVAVDADGAFDDRLALPLGVLPGVHTLQLNGARADGELVSIAAGIVVRAAADEPVAPGASRPEDDTLAVTGTSTGPGALLALWLLVVGGGAVIVARRRTRQR
ncbi:MAG: fibronectin type III domain-containing protein [Cellulomonas sp.]|nr:fibronectin type III domain-containing protein [Cellulomonas sp.]MCR6649417.1 fibronectin type III domain-containing protein [Cellulomonas sp.]